MITSTFDNALRWQFVDLDGRLRQLRFRRNDSPSPDVLDGTGQLIAVIADRCRPDHDDAIAIKAAPGVAVSDIDKALSDWQGWAARRDTGQLAELQCCIHAAGTGLSATDHTVMR